MSAIHDAQVVGAMVAGLSASKRQERQKAASALSVLSKEHADAILPFVADVIDALSRPEARTRWECLDVLTSLVALDVDACEPALGEAETALFDEESGPLRLSAMRFFCKYGSMSEDRAEKTWPLIDEAIQCYHGDLEFQDMLLAVIEFSEGTLGEDVRAALARRMSFDAKNGKGLLKKRASQIVANVES